MAKGPNQKLKLIYLMKILLERTDGNHSLTMQEILRALEAYGVNAERKSIYDDMETLRTYGMDIIGEQNGRVYSYYVASREFEMAELKLLVDAVQSSKFITEKKSNELIKKIEGLASRYEANELQRQVYVAGRIKTMNETVYYSVDKIHGAISQNVKIKFQYFQWNVKKEPELRHNGEVYLISPWSLLWDNENYYMIGYDSDAGIMKHYRVDKMLHLELTEERREGKERFEKMDMAQYGRKHFSMFDGEEQHVKLEMKNYLAGVVIDRFGKDVPIRKKDEEHFTVTVHVAVSPQFLSWVMSFGTDAKIIGPDHVVEKMKDEVRKLADLYKKEV